MADTTTATRLPASTSRFTRAATPRMRSIPAMEVPPNFITMRGMGALGLFRYRHRYARPLGVGAGLDNFAPASRRAAFTGPPRQ
jgi:hypothetical protein